MKNNMPGRLRKLAHLKNQLSATKDEMRKIRLLNEINELSQKIWPQRINYETECIKNKTLTIKREKAVNSIKGEIKTLWRIWHELKTEELKKYIAKEVGRKENELKRVNIGKYEKE